MAATRMTTYIATAVMAICLLYWTFKGTSSLTTPPARWTSSAIIPLYEESSLARQYEIPVGVGINVPEEQEAPARPADKEPKSSASETGPSAPSFPERFPTLLWQSATAVEREENSVEARNWHLVNEYYEYNFLDEKDATSFIHEHFEHLPSIIRFWDDLASDSLRAHILRYLVLLTEGGVYTDIDTSSTVPVDEWIPKELKTQNINAVVGIECGDAANGNNTTAQSTRFSHRTLMGKPGHALFDTAARGVISNLQFLARQQRVDLKALKLKESDLAEALGSGLFTDVVMQVLMDQGHDVDLDAFRGLKDAALFGDILVLPVSAFYNQDEPAQTGEDTKEGSDRRGSEEVEKAESEES